MGNTQPFNTWRGTQSEMIHEFVTAGLVFVLASQGLSFSVSSDSDSYDITYDEFDFDNYADDTVVGGAMFLDVNSEKHDEKR